MSTNIPPGLARRYTKLQSLYLAGPGALRPIGADGVYGITAAAPCGCAGTEASGSDARPDGSPARWRVIHDRRLEQGAGVEGLLEPVSNDGDWINPDTALVAWRFPETEYCLGCGLLQRWEAPPRAYAVSKRGRCREYNHSGHPKRNTTRQLERVWVCPDGHLDSFSPTCDRCGNGLRRGGEDEYDNLYLRCAACSTTEKVSLRDAHQPCTARLPHACSRAQANGAQCSKGMELRRLADPAIWRSRLQTVLFMPEVMGQTEHDVLAVRDAISSPSFPSDASRERQVETVQILTRHAHRPLDSAAVHSILAALLDVPDLGPDADVADREERLRAEELHQLRTLLRTDVSDAFFAGSAAAALTSASHAVTSVSPIGRLRTTTILTSARRLEGTPGRHVLFGHHPDRPAPHPRLLALEGFGEGILFWLNPDAFAGTGPKRKQAVHSLSHALLGALASDAGVGLAGIRERLYPDEETPAVLLYVATGDRVGTLGGLSSLGEQPGLLDDIVSAHLRTLRHCRLDPVCLERGGTCHHCLQLPETCCEGDPTAEGRDLNGGLDRRLLALRP